MENIEQIFREKAIKSDDSNDELRKYVIENLFSNENIEGKTELGNPMLWSCLQSLYQYLVNKNLMKSAKIIENFIQTSMKYLLSKDRKSRKEYVDALQSLSYSFKTKEEKQNTLVI